EFRFQLTENEKNELVTSCDRFKSLKHSSTLPYVFTEQGVAMLSAVLRSRTAIEISISIINAFVAMRRFLVAHEPLLQRLDTLEKRQIGHEMVTDARFEQVFAALDAKRQQPEQGVFFDGQVFDAYRFVSDLLREAQKSIVLIDNYVDDSVLALLAKRQTGVSAIVLTRSISKTLALDLEKHNAQYPPVTIREFADSHDRFLILDGNVIYHLGASLKDLGKKWFAFAKMDRGALSVMERVADILEKCHA
ncbi:MAG TPA: ORF6N domain-containing protein, partial [Lentisphaeria bacterium]|nr:ORF6N domain-containing protein [Lentisphaeria bacterium]